MQVCPHCRLSFARVVSHIPSCRQRIQNERDSLIRRQTELKHQSETRDNEYKRQLELKETENAELRRQLAEEKKREFVLEQPPSMEFYTPLNLIMGSYNSVEQLILSISRFMSIHKESIISAANRDEIITNITQIINEGAKPCHRPLIQKLASKQPEQRFNGVYWRGLISLTNPTQEEIQLIKFCDYVGSTQQTFNDIAIKVNQINPAIRAVIINRENKPFLSQFMNEICIDRQQLRYIQW